ncbi:MAG TPA: TonB-dependent receptor [Bacteroidales bacterium]|nr:TonB-dependent receptor [Bacteroidales bacterium]
MKKRHLLVFITALILTNYGFSQENHSILNDTININEVVITGSRTYVNRNNVPLTVSVVSKDKIELSSESALLPVLSEQVPGLFVTERGITGFGVATGSAGHIMLRGIGGNPNTRVLMLVDGNPQFMGIMGHPLPDTYIASDVEKVEVIRGPASTLYGTNAMGGVINIITKEQKEDGFMGNGRIMYGSYNTQKYMVNAGFRKKGFNVIASFNHDQTKGHRDSSDFRINNGYLKAGYEFSRYFKMEGNISLANFDATDPGQEGGFAGYTYDITRGMSALVFDNKFDKTNGSFRFFYNFGEHNITDGFHSKDKNYGIVVFQAFNFFRGNTITFGYDYKKYGGFAENVLAMGGNGMVLGDTTVFEMAAYAYIQQELFSKITLNAGFRLEHNNIYGYEPVPTGGVAYRPTASTTIKASVSKGFRSPTIRELYLFTPANASLKPERMMDYEISILQKLLMNKISLELTLYKANGDNLIQTVMTATGPLNENTGEFSNTGVEFTGSFKPTDKLTFNATCSYISMKELIVAAPEQQLNLSGSYKLKRLNFNLSLQHIHNLCTQISPSTLKESYTLFNSRISWNINKSIDIFIKGENLTNRKYSINYGYPMPGIIFFGGINLHL